MDSCVKSLINLPREIWLSSLFPSLSIQELCRLDYAVLNKAARPSLLSVLTGAEIHHEVILSPNVINWIRCRKIKLLRVKLVDDITIEDLLQFTRYSPHLLSLNTWDFDAGTDFMQSIYDIDSDSQSTNSTDTLGSERIYRKMDEQAVRTILQHCPQLRCLRLHEMKIREWCDIFMHNIGRFAHLDEVNYVEQSYYNQSFLINRTSLKISTAEVILSTPLLTSIATHYPTLTAVELDSPLVLQHDIDAGILALAQHCAALQRVGLRVEVQGDTLLELCRLRPNLVELQVVEFFDEEDQHFVQESIRMLPGTLRIKRLNVHNFCFVMQYQLFGACCRYEYSVAVHDILHNKAKYAPVMIYTALQVFFSHTFNEGDHDPLSHTLADYASELQVLRVTHIHCMSAHCWVRFTYLFIYIYIYMQLLYCCC